jgi:hypothetical protein
MRTALFEEFEILPAHSGVLRVPTRKQHPLLVHTRDERLRTRSGHRKVSSVNLHYHSKTWLIGGAMQSFQRSVKVDAIFFFLRGDGPPDWHHWCPLTTVHTTPVR